MSSPDSRSRPPEPLPALIIGAGPAGLAASQQLKLLGVDHLVLEKDEVGASWGRLYDSLTLHTGKHLSHLPGMRFPRGTPLFIARGAFVQYLHDYRRRFDLPVQSGVEVRRLARHDGLWMAETSAGAYQARSIIVASGIISAPRQVTFEGMGEFRGEAGHSIHYRNPERYRGKSVLIIGAGNSAGEIAAELASAGVTTAVAVRSGANVVPRQLLGIPIQYLAWGMQKLPRRAQEVLVAAMRGAIDAVQGPPPIPRPAHGPLDGIPLIGFGLVRAIRSGRVRLHPGIERFTATGARFADGREEQYDAIILATGYRPALRFLEPLVSLDARGFARRRDRVTSADLHFVGHNYDSTGGLFNIRRDAPLAAAAVKAGLQRR